MTSLIYKTEAMFMWVYDYADVCRAFEISPHLDFDEYGKLERWEKARTFFPKGKITLFWQEWLHLDIFIIQNKAKIEIFVGTVIATCFDLICQNSIMEIHSIFRKCLMQFAWRNL